MRKVLHNKAKQKKKNNKDGGNYSSHAKPQSLIKTAAVAFKFSLFASFHKNLLFLVEPHKATSLVGTSKMAARGNFEFRGLLDSEIL